MNFKSPAIFLLLFATIALPLSAQDEEKQRRHFLIGNSLTWDTVPPKMDGDTQWHVDCGKSLPWMFANPEKPCVKTSTLWPAALKEKQYDVISVQSHYGSTLAEDAVTISELMKLQPKAEFIIHTGWARSADRAAEWAMTDKSPAAEMNHSVTYFDALLDLVKKANPGRTVTRTKAMEMLQQVAEDIEAGKAPISDVAELYRDKIHMNVVTGRYLMHNTMRDAHGQKRSAAGFEKLEPGMKTYLDSVLDRVLN